ncbi:MAG: hypothetical protein AVDCRST_MAG96-1045, partial [uncultured Segetibacter sp.]
SKQFAVLLLKLFPFFPILLLVIFFKSNFNIEQHAI